MELLTRLERALLLYDKPECASPDGMPVIDSLTALLECDNETVAIIAREAIAHWCAWGETDPLRHPRLWDTRWRGFSRCMEQLRDIQRHLLSDELAECAIPPVIENNA